MGNRDLSFDEGHDADVLRLHVDAVVALIPSGAGFDVLQEAAARPEFERTVFRVLVRSPDLGFVRLLVGLHDGLPHFPLGRTLILWVLRYGRVVWPAESDEAGGKER